MSGVAAHGLRPPSRLIYPHTHRCQRTRTVKLGSSDAAILEITTWDKCHECVGGERYPSSRQVMLRVPCDSLPHCNACECGDGHSILLADDQVRELLAALS